MKMFYKKQMNSWKLSIINISRRHSKSEMNGVQLVSKLWQQCDVNVTLGKPQPTSDIKLKSDASDMDLIITILVTDYGLLAL